MSLLQLISQYTNFENPKILLYLIPLILVILFLTLKDFIKISEDEVSRKRREKLKIFVSILRILAFVLLILALAAPFKFKTELTKGNPYVKILSDNTTSMELFDQDVFKRIDEGLKKEIDVDSDMIMTKDRSPIGDSLLSNLERDKSVLLISDGNNNYGSSLDDVSTYASAMNATINVLVPQVKNNDASVVILGPSKTTDKIENQFTVKIYKTNPEEVYRLIVWVDNEIITSRDTKEGEFVFIKTFSEGYHKITAKIDKQDYFPQNNVFYKTVKVVPQAKILFYSEKESPLATLLEQVYSVTKVNSLDNLNLEDYNAIVINDIDAGKLNDKVDLLVNYISKGNGLFVVGGSNSYDLGSYKGSSFETLLPVFVAQPGKKEGDNNIVVLIDISGSTQVFSGGAIVVDIEKAMALGVVDDLSGKNKVAVVAFNDQAYVVSDLNYLVKSRNEVHDKISRLTTFGTTQMAAGLSKAFEILQNTQGSKNVILLSDGCAHDQDEVYSYARSFDSKGIKIYTITVGESNQCDEVMKRLAASTGGIYFQSQNAKKVKILFGETTEQERKQDKYPIVILNNNHFITEDLKTSAVVYGFNTVTPKSTARLLVSTDTGEPLITIWRYGLGRILSFSTDDGNLYSSDLLTKENSKLLVRSINWAIGDPERNLKNYVDIQDTRINESTELTIKTDGIPKAEGLDLYKSAENTYKATLQPQDLGFSEVLGAVFAVNYPREYEKIGINDDLRTITINTNGVLFEKEDINKIIEAIKLQSKKSITKRYYVRWPFVITAIIIFLIEIALRRYFELSKNKI